MYALMKNIVYICSSKAFKSASHDQTMRKNTSINYLSSVLCIEPNKDSDCTIYFILCTLYKYRYIYTLYNVIWHTFIAVIWYFS